MCILLTSGMASASEYSVHVDLSSLKNDRLFIEVDVPKVDIDTATFIFPVTIPGTYQTHLWWRLVHDFKAFDAEGSPLPVSRSVDSQYVIGEAQRLARVSYWVDDTFDDLDDRAQVFQPAGTSFEKGTVFVFNHSGVTGYIEGMQSLPYTVTVRRDPNLFCSTALKVSERNDEFVRYAANTYDDLIDGPVVICKPDTATFQVNGTSVLVSLVHHSDESYAEAYAKELQTVTSGIEEYLPSLPVDRYAFLLYLWDGDTSLVKRGRFAQGALEHNYSSLYFWRLNPRPFGLKDVAAHEFLHILVPLNVHSREIDEFNFRDPAMSAHLWLYEGVTEYFADQSLLRSGISNENMFLSRIKRFSGSMNYLPEKFSLTEFSRNVLEPENQRTYPIIYRYGPLNALLLDILLRQEYGTEGGLLELVYELMEQFGPAKPFEDDELFDVIEKITSKKIGDYCRRYIEGEEHIPLAELLPSIGLQFKDSVTVEAYSFGIDVTGTGEDMKSLFIKPEGANPLNIQEGDELISVDGRKISTENARYLRRLWNPTSDHEITVTVVRDGQEFTLTGKAHKGEKVRHFVIEEDPDATDEQIAFRRLVLYGS